MTHCWTISMVVVVLVVLLVAYAIWHQKQVTGFGSPPPRVPTRPPDVPNSYGAIHLWFFETPLSCHAGLYTPSKIMFVLRRKKHFANYAYINFYICCAYVL